MSTIGPIGGQNYAILSSTARAMQAINAQQVPDQSAKPAANGASLWSVLTDEEQDYFSQMSQMGSLSYGPGGNTAGAAPMPVGQRVDVRG